MAIINGVDKPRFHESTQSNATRAEVKWSAGKTVFVVGMYLGAFIGIIWFPSLENLAIFLIITAGVLCFGHSLGMHRRLIHNSFECPLWLEYCMVYLGTLVGLGGPFTMIQTHDIRDWAQRQPICHDYFAHRKSFLRDAFWQILCKVEMVHPPTLVLESRVQEDRFYQFIERTWWLQQIPASLVLFWLGGIEWVLWGTCARVSACVTGHWLVGYFAHRGGDRKWHVNGAGVQGYNIKFCGLITFGECWHNNHHAFPGSAKLGLLENQSDPGWWVLSLFEKLGLVWNIQTPETIAHRPELSRVGTSE